MKAQLICAEHTVTPGQVVVEIWYKGEFIGQVCAADGPGVRVISKYPMTTREESMVTEVLMGELPPK
jgi:hypothetical protein